MKFVHLHVHTEYSLLDGLSKIKKLVQKVKDFNMEAVGLTDHGVMYGAIEFYQACKKEDVKPIIGVEAYVMKSEDSHTEKLAGKKTNANHLLLLAKNKRGYENLMELTSIAHLEGFYYKPRFDKQTLKKYSEGLICTSACPQGEIAEMLRNGDYELAKEKVLWYRDLFKNDYYLEIQRHEYEHYIDAIQNSEVKSSIRKMTQIEKVINEGVAKLSRELGIPLIATNDVHYLEQDDAEAQDALVCVATNTTVDQVERLRYIDTPTFYFRSGEEMAGLFPEYPEALSNTVEIVKKCNLELTLGKWWFPKLPDLTAGKSEEEILRDEVKNRVGGRYAKVTKEIVERIDFELEVICQKGYAGYFLIMADLTKWAGAKGIAVTTRGSAAGSIVSYILQITTVDPLRYYLPFERFLNPYRPTPPDIDLDIADNRRVEMIQYITEKFGQEKVAQICTFGRMMARGAVRDITRVLGYPYAIGDTLSKLIPMGSQGFPMTVERALVESSELRVQYQSNADAQKIIDLARKVEGSARHASVHAAAVVVAPTKITHFTPLQRETKGDKIITQYEMHSCEDVGLIKFDILGITNLTVLDAAVEIVAKTRGTRIELQQIPLDDKKVFEMLGQGDTVGVFQMSGSGMTKWLTELKPTKVEDIMAMIALYRPGPMRIIPEYIFRKQGKSRVEYYHPKMKKFLEPSYGLLVYQDDLLFTALELAGYNWEEVDKLRKAVGKKIPEEMAKQHQKFVAGCLEHSGMTEEEAEKIWNLFEPFQGYGFNKAHAAAYGMVAYQTAYMKANYPVEYMTAMLTADAGDTVKIAAGVTEARKIGIVVLPPDINYSGVEFAVEDHKESVNNQAIRFGLNAIKNVGGAALEAIITDRAEQPYISLTDFFARVDSRKVNKKVLESLIKAGAFDQFGSRTALLAGAEVLRQQVEQQKKKRAAGQVGLFANPEDDSVDKTRSRLETFAGDKLPQVADNKPDQKLAWEKELLGFYLSENPLLNKLSGIELAITHRIGDLYTVKEGDGDEQLMLKVANENMEGQIVKVGGIITKCREVTTKKSAQQMVFTTLNDETGSVNLVVFPKVFAVTRKCWQVDEIVLVVGKVDFRDGEVNILVDQVISLNDGSNMKIEQESAIPAEREEISQENASRQVLVVPRETNKQKLMTLNSLLKDHPGNDYLTLIFENGQNGGKRLAVPYGIDFSSQLRKEIGVLLKPNK